MVDHNFIVESADENKRLDIFLAEKMPIYSRSYIKKGIEEGKVKVSGQIVKPNYKLKEQDVVFSSIQPPPKPTLEPENIPLNIIYEDDDIIVLDKTRGMVVYPAQGNYSGTLVNALLYHTKNLSDINGVMRPGIVHRLDKDTSGIMVIAKNNAAHENLARQFSTRQVEKTYLAVVWGIINENAATINAPIGRHPVNRLQMTVTDENAKEAITHFQVIERFSEFTYVKVNIETGRTHQIRVHMKFIGHPIVGDLVYSKKKNPFKINGQALHSYKISFNHPRTKEQLEFEASIPDDFQTILDNLRKKEGI